MANAAGNDVEALGRVGTLDDLDSPFADLVQGIPQLWPAVAAIHCRQVNGTFTERGEDVVQQRIGPGDGFQHPRRAIHCPAVDTQYR